MRLTADACLQTVLLCIDVLNRVYRFLDVIQYCTSSEVLTVTEKFLKVLEFSFENSRPYKAREKTEVLSLNVLEKVVKF